MAKIYASLIRKEKMTIDEVPANLQAAVRELLGEV